MTIATAIQQILRQRRLWLRRGWQSEDTECHICMYKLKVEDDACPGCDTMRMP